MQFSTRKITVACVGALALFAAQPAQGQMGLSRVEYLALQQEMRDRGCGNRHAGGVVNAETRAAIRTCAQRLGVAANARAVLNAMLPDFTSTRFAGSSGEPIDISVRTTGTRTRTRVRASQTMDTDPNTAGVQHDATPGMRRGVEGTQPGQQQPRINPGSIGGEGAATRARTPAGQRDPANAPRTTQPNPSDNANPSNSPRPNTNPTPTPSNPSPTPTPTP